MHLEAVTEPCGSIMPGKAEVPIGATSTLSPRPSRVRARPGPNLHPRGPRSIEPASLCELRRRCRRSACIRSCVPFMPIAGTPMAGQTAPTGREACGLYVGSRGTARARPVVGRDEDRLRRAAPARRSPARGGVMMHSSTRVARTATAAAPRYFTFAAGNICGERQLFERNDRDDWDASAVPIVCVAHTGDDSNTHVIGVVRIWRRSPGDWWGGRSASTRLPHRRHRRALAGSDRRRPRARPQALIVSAPPVQRRRAVLSPPALDRSAPSSTSSARPHHLIKTALDALRHR